MCPAVVSADLLVAAVPVVLPAGVVPAVLPAGAVPADPVDWAPASLWAADWVVKIRRG